MRHQLLFSACLYFCASDVTSASNEILTLVNRTSPAFSQVTAPPAILAYLVPRCENPCGYYTQLCCGSGATCYTDLNNEAQCATAAGAAITTQTGGYWEYYTSTYVETDYATKTAVWSTYITTTACATVVAQSTETASAATCDWDEGESSCGNICCSSTEYCLVSGECAASASTASYNPALRVTSSALVTVVQSASVTTTVAFESAIATGSSATVIESTNNATGLSGGAIAGIVIGVIIGIIILLLLCIIFCFRAAWDGLMGVFGIGTGGRRRKETVEVEEYSRHGSRSNSRRYVENRPSRPEKRSGGGNGLGWGSLALGLGGLTALLGIRNARKGREEKSEYSEASSGYYDSEYTCKSLTAQD